MKTIEYTTYQKDENGFRSIHYEFDKNTVTEKQFENLCINAAKYASILKYSVDIYYEKDTYHISFCYYLNTYTNSGIELNSKAAQARRKGIARIISESFDSE